MRLPKKPVPPPEIKPRWDTAYQHAGPHDNPVPTGKDQFPVHPPKARITPEHTFLKPGAAVSRSRSDHGPSARVSDNLEHASPVERQFEALKHYQKNYEVNFREARPVDQPRAIVRATPGERRAMNLFDRAIQKSDPQGLKTMTGEFAALIDFREEKPLTFFKYQDGRSVTQRRDMQASSQYCLHSHRYDPNSPAAPKGDPFSNVGSSRFPTFPDYLGASNATVRAEYDGNPRPTFLMKNGNDYYRYYPDEVRFDKLDRSGSSA